MARSAGCWREVARPRGRVGRGVAGAGAGGPARLGAGPVSRLPGSYYFISFWRDGRNIPKLRGQVARSRAEPARRSIVSRIVLLAISVVAGAALALAVSFTVSSVLASANSSPVNQQLFNYGTK